MAISFVSGSNVSVGAETNTGTLACDVGSGSNRLLVVVVMSDDG